MVAGVVVGGGELEAGAGEGVVVEGVEEAAEPFVPVGFSGSDKLFFVFFEGKHIWGKYVLLMSLSMSDTSQAHYMRKLQHILPTPSKKPNPWGTQVKKWKVRSANGACRLISERFAGYTVYPPQSFISDADYFMALSTISGSDADRNTYKKSLFHSPYARGD